MISGTKILYLLNRLYEPIRFQCNLQSGTIAGSEWISNCFYCIQTADQGLKVFRDYFNGTLTLGKTGPVYPDGFFKA